MFEERRTDPRERLELPLRLGNDARAITRDISAAGCFFEVEGDHRFDGPVAFELEFPQMGMKLTSSAEIVRIERRAGRTGVAVRLVAPRLEVLEEEPA
jgi:c-di-GMP-binding flagellar brake protein YcgR